MVLLKHLHRSALFFRVSASRPMSCFLLGLLLKIELLLVAGDKVPCRRGTLDLVEGSKFIVEPGALFGVLRESSSEF